MRTKKDQQEIDSLKNELERSRRRSNDFQERFHQANLEREILCDRFKLTEEQRDELAREARDS